MWAKTGDDNQRDCGSRIRVNVKKL